MMMVDFLPRRYDAQKEPISLGGPNVILTCTLPSNERGASAHARSIDRRATKDARGASARARSIDRRAMKDARGALILRHKQKLERSLFLRFIRS